MRPLFFISELGVSDWHGVGITLQRIVTSEIQGVWQIGAFGAQFPDAPHLAAVTRHVTAWFDRSVVKRLFGCTIAARIGRISFIREMWARDIARDIIRAIGSIPNPLVLACPQGPDTLLVVRALGRIRELPYVTWFMDDHLLRLKDGTWIHVEEFKSLIEQHLSDARKVFAISPILADFYERTYGVRSEVLFGPSPRIPMPASRVVSDSGICRVAYFGILLPWQMDAIERLVPFAGQATFELHIYSNIPPTEVPPSLKGPGVLFHKRLPQNEYFEAMRSYDALLLPIGFSDSVSHLSHFNIATKMSEYLATGTVVMAVGPSDSAMVEFLRPHDAAVLMTDITETTVKQAVNEITNPTRRAIILQNATHLVSEHLSLAKMQNIWSKSLLI